MLDGLSIPAGNPALDVRKVALGIHRQLAAQIRFSMFVHVARLSHKASVIALRQLV